MKPTLQKIVQEGFRDTGRRFADLEIYAHDEDRILYDPIRDTREITYKFDEKIDTEVKQTPQGY